MKKHTIFLGLYLFSFLTNYAQNPNLDSLLTCLDTVQTDTTRIDLLDALAEAYNTACMMDSAEFYVHQAIDESQAKKLTYREVRAKHLLAYILYNKGNDEEALSCFTEAKNYYEKHKLSYDKFWMYYYLGAVYEGQSQIQKALTYYDSSKIWMDLTDTVQTFNLNYRLGTLFWYQKDFEKSKKYYFKNINLTENSRDTYLLYTAYADLGLLYNDDQKSDSAIYYLEMALPIIEPVDPEWGACIKGCLGTNYKSLGDCKTALKYFEASLAIKASYEDAAECLSFIEIAHCYLQLGNFEKAEFYNEIALDLLPKMKDNKLKRDALVSLVNLYKEKGDFERALINYESLKMMEDSLFHIDNQKAIEEFEVKYQTQEKQSQLELQTLALSKQRNLIISGILILAFLIALIVLAWRNILHKQKSNALLAERNKHLEELDMTKARFFSNISHELRTPLTMVTAPLEKIVENVKDELIKEDLQLVYRNSQKLLVLVNEILDLSKLESGQMELNFSTIQLEEVLRRIFFAFQSYAKIRNIQLAFSSHLPEKIWVETDIAKLEKILNNLISNAIKFSNPGGKVLLEIAYSKHDTGSAQNLFEINVTDSGKGIHQEDLPKIFNRFYQSNTDQLVGGTGIGLALTKELVQLFGGSLKVESQLGKGSTFFVILPLKQTEPQVSQTSTVKIPKLASDETMVKDYKTKNYIPISIDGQKPKILIVEDNPEMSRFLIKTLSEFYECHNTYDGSEALAKLKKEHFDIISSDVMMPQMDGFEFLEKVREPGTIYKDTPFILLTARSLEADKLEGFQLGVDDYITKPFSTKELIARIDNLLKNKLSRTSSKEKHQEETIESNDRKVLKQAEQIVLNHLSDKDFGVQKLAAALAVSQRSLGRIINRLSGMSPVSFIREIRLQKAYQMLQRQQFLTVTEVCYEVGIDNPSYFNRTFKERFGVTPKAVLGKVVV